MKKGKKIFYVLITLIQVIVLVAIALLNYFTKSKMGMLRHIVHKNYLLEQQYPIQIIKYMSILFLIFVMVLVLILYLKRRQYLKKIVFVMNFIMLFMVCLFTYIVLIFSTYDIKAFYYIAIMLFTMTLLQIIKTLIFTICYKK